ncbi:MAG: hypothetical protein GY811_22930 [Myxococcales bacterium]|nr:hypothetical protein [Myxococcales bacterium]
MSNSATSPPATSPPATSPPATSPPATSPRSEVEMASAPVSLANDGGQECAYPRQANTSLASINDSGHSLYQASRCAARKGDFQTSLFHLCAAASSGYDNVEDLRTDPLLRPLYQSSRWQLVTDLVAENQRARLQRPAPPTLCALIKRVRTSSKALLRDTEANLASHRFF